MKKTIASVLCIGYFAFGVAAHAADSGYTPPGRISRKDASSRVIGHSLRE
ncbi:hypothetical protein SAMN02787142_6565 [Burkholderia sp. WP9]|nr:hypothetical protein [Burkholderia sp. WP9]SEF01706.1 hypothetical protein SAMN02787142_6565 [Burkholderia sp. WP9]